MVAPFRREICFPCWIHEFKEHGRSTSPRPQHPTSPGRMKGGLPDMARIVDLWTRRVTSGNSSTALGRTLQLRNPDQDLRFAPCLAFNLVKLTKYKTQWPSGTLELLDWLRPYSCWGKRRHPSLAREVTLIIKGIQPSTREDGCSLASESGFALPDWVNVCLPSP